MSDQHAAVDEVTTIGHERLIFFSDAVFAIAITLLALDIRIPELVGRVSNGQLVDALIGLAPKLFAYALSFAVIGLFWLAHWRRYLLIERANETLVLLNVVLLGFVALIPFPTALLGAHGDLPSALIVYALIVSAAGLMGSATWIYAARHSLVRSGVTPRIVELGMFRALSIPMVMLASLALLPFVGTTITEMSWLLILPLQVLIARRFRARGSDDRGALQGRR